MKPSRSLAAAAITLMLVVGGLSWWDKLLGKITPKPTEQHGTSGGRGPTIRPPEIIFHPHEPMVRIPERERRGP